MCGSAGIEPHEIGYIEAHGTGTVAGDGQELGAIDDWYGRAAGRTCDAPLLIGSVKSNMGHCEGASGLAGIQLKLSCVHFFRHMVCWNTRSSFWSEPVLSGDCIAVDELEVQYINSDVLLLAVKWVFLCLQVSSSSASRTSTACCQATSTTSSPTLTAPVCMRVSSR